METIIIFPFFIPVNIVTVHSVSYHCEIGNLYYYYSKVKLNILEEIRSSFYILPFKFNSTLQETFFPVMHPGVVPALDSPCLKFVVLMEKPTGSYFICFTFDSKILFLVYVSQKKTGRQIIKKKR